MTDAELSGVWVSDRALDANEGAWGDTLLRIELNCNEDDIQDYECIEEGKGYRDWLIPAAFLNSRAEVTLET
jgi:hypothetical protein